MPKKTHTHFLNERNINQMLVLYLSGLSALFKQFPQSRIFPTQGSNLFCLPFNNLSHAGSTVGIVLDVEAFHCHYYIVSTIHI